MHTNRYVAATVIDAAGDKVGGYAGAHELPRRIFEAQRAQTIRIPLLVGTASFQADLGYRVPPGTWRLTVPFNLGDGRELVGGPLEFTVTT